LTHKTYKQTSAFTVVCISLTPHHSTHAHVDAIRGSPFGEISVKRLEAQSVPQSTN